MVSKRSVSTAAEIHSCPAPSVQCWHFWCLQTIQQEQEIRNSKSHSHRRTKQQPIPALLLFTSGLQAKCTLHIMAKRYVMQQEMQWCHFRIENGRAKNNPFLPCSFYSLPVLQTIQQTSLFFLCEKHQSLSFAAPSGMGGGHSCFAPDGGGKQSSKRCQEKNKSHLLARCQRSEPTLASDAAVNFTQKDEAFCLPWFLLPLPRYFDT